MQAILNDLMSWISANPNWAGLVVLIVAALESFLVVGLFIPGTVVMFGIGALIAAGSMELVPTLIWAAIGASLGDGSSYLIGRHFHQQLRVMWPFRKYPEMINRSVTFFDDHGGKSIVLARFVGPVRPLLPAVAGMLDMPAKRFFIVNLASSVLWAPAYILPGVLFGASLAVAAEIAGHLAILLALLVAVLWFSWWLVRRLARSCQPRAQAIQMHILDWSQRHPAVEPLTAALLDPQHPEARGMTILTALLLVASWLFLLIAQHLTPGSMLANLDLYLFHWMQALRTSFGDQLMIFTTQLGSNLSLYAFTTFSCVWLLWKGYWRAAIHWLVTVACVGLLTLAVKIYTRVERPPTLAQEFLSYSFPSAHTSLSIAVFGFMAVIVAREMRGNWRWIPYSVAAFLIAAIGFSRLYLGAHWFSDVLGGLCLGTAWVALIGIGYRHHPAPNIPLRHFAPLCFGIFWIATSLHIHQFANDEAQIYQPLPQPSMAMTQAHWLSDGWQKLPTARNILSGNLNQNLNLQWMADEDHILNRLSSMHWEKPMLASTSSLLSVLNNDTAVQKLPVLPLLHNGKPPQIVLTQPTEDADKILVIRLWKTNFHDADNQHPLWVGNLSYLGINDLFGVLRYLRMDRTRRGALDELADKLTAAKHQWVKRKSSPHDPAHESRVLLITDSVGTDT